MKQFFNGQVTLHIGDCLQKLDELEENSIDSVACDPPYHLTSIVDRFGGENAAPAQVGKTGAFARASAGFMGKQWDGGDIAFTPEVWRKVYRVLKPGGHLVAFGATRGYHRMACAIEDAGFEIRDSLMWLFGTGFPKSHDVSKGIDNKLGFVREKGKARPKIGTNKTRVEQGYRPNEVAQSYDSKPASDEAKEWEGWGTALKPAYEPIVLARKPLEGTVAANVLKHRTGAINIDACRVEHASEDDLAVSLSKNPGRDDLASSDVYGANRPQQSVNTSGRWPANVLHDGSEQVTGMFPDSEGQSGAVNGAEPSSTRRNVFPALKGDHAPRVPRGDKGSAARFFYTAKADAHDRVGSKHPTVKPVDLMRWLVRLITPPGGTVLDMFAGSGTTGEAAYLEGFNAILIEREQEYANDIERRMSLINVSPQERRIESLKARNKIEESAGPLFA